MPSRYEPCGLNQLFSLRYGTLPVVRATGGLADSSHSRSIGETRATGTGFVFDHRSPPTALALARFEHALQLCTRICSAWTRAMVQNAMRSATYSWSHQRAGTTSVHRSLATPGN